MDIRFYLSLFLRRLHWFLLLTAIGTVAGIAIARYLPPVYVARARLVVESEQIPGELAASTVSVKATEQLEIIRQRILTRDTLVDMSNRLQIHAAAPGEPARRLDADDIVLDLRNRIAISTTGGTVVRGQTQATLVNVSFDAARPALAAAVANDVVTLILKADVEMRTGVARQTLDFFEREVSRLDRELAEQGARILAFKQANKDALPDSLDFRRSQQAALAERLLDLQRQEAELRDRRERMVALQAVAGTDAAAAGLSPEARQLAQLRDELAVQQSVLAAEHPRIRMLQGQIEALDKVVAARTGAGMRDAAGRELSAHEMQLATIDGQIDWLVGQQVQVSGQSTMMQAAIDATPTNAITLGTLERDYANLRAQYDQAVANKARAETGDMIEAMSKGQRISVIEQAVAPRDPERPNRMLIAAGGVAGGMAAGTALILLLVLLNPAIRRPEDLTRRLNITAFAVLPHLETRADTARSRLRWVLGFLLLLAVLAGGIWAVDRLYMPLDLLIARVVDRV